MEALPFAPGSPAYAAAGVVAAPSGKVAPDVRAILARNVFDFRTGALPKAAARPVTRPVQRTDPPASCDGSLRLVGSVFSARTRDWSLASVTVSGEPPQLYREGSRVHDRELVAVMPDAAYLRDSDDQLCALHMFANGPAAPVTTEHGPVTAPAADLEQAIRATSPGQFTVDRSFVERVLQHPAELLGRARIVPHEESGRVLGAKLYGIRRDSALAKLGLQNGDLLRAINGFDLSSPDSALDAYAKLRNATHLTVALVRRDRPVTIDVEIAP
jgi:general secretion pathway protein C